MEFGVPSKKRVKQEKYPETPVITLHPFEGLKTSRKIEFNNKAYEAMGFVKDDYNYVAFSFNPSDYTQNAVVNAAAAGMEKNSAALKVSKNGIVSNKAHYEEIKARYNESMEGEVEFTIVDTGRMFNGSKVFNLKKLEANSQEEQSEQIEEAASTEVQGIIANDKFGNDPVDSVEPEVSSEDVQAESEEQEEESESVFGQASTPANEISNDIVRDEEEDDDLPF